MQNSCTSRRSLRSALVAALMGASALSGAGLAHAESDPTIDVNSNAESTLLSMEKCADHSEEFRFRFYYSPEYQGAWVNVGHNIYDLMYIKMMYSPAYPLHFCENGSGGGQQVANNAASAYNWYEGYVGTIHTSAGYKGDWEMIGPRSGHAVLNTRNDNRSIEFSRTW